MYKRVYTSMHNDIDLYNVVDLDNDLDLDVDEKSS